MEDKFQFGQVRGVYVRDKGFPIAGYHRGYHYCRLKISACRQRFNAVPRFLLNPSNLISV